MTVDGSDVVEAHFLEQGAGQHHALQMFFRAAREFPHRGHLPQNFLAALAQVGIHLPRQHARQIIGERPDVLGYRHVVIVQHDQKIGRQGAGVIQRFEGHAGRQRTIADNGHDAAILAALRSRDGHSQSRADRGAGVTDAESVVFALAAGGERRQPCVLLDGMQLLPPAGQHFVRISLVANIPDQAVIGGVEHVMKGNRELYGAQSCGKMPAAGGDALNQKLAQLLRQIR